jgi:hypothetical protein
MPPDLAQLPALEHSLWAEDTRFDRALMDRTFAPDFFEFGRSGRRYTRDEMLFGPLDTQEIDATLHNLALHPLAQDVVLVTYQSEAHYPEGTEWGNRSSIWDRSSGAWQLRFHQGTAIPEGLGA